MAKYKIKYWQGRNIKVKEIEAESKRAALMKFYMSEGNADVISIETVES